MALQFCDLFRGPVLQSGSASSTLAFPATTSPWKQWPSFVAGIATQAGMALAEAPTRKHNQISDELQMAVPQLMAGLRQLTN